MYNPKISLSSSRLSTPLQMKPVLKGGASFTDSALHLKMPLRRHEAHVHKHKFVLIVARPAFLVSGSSATTELVPGMDTHLYQSMLAKSNHHMVNPQ